MKYIPLIIAEFPKTYALPKERRAIIQTGLLTLLHVSLSTNLVVPVDFRGPETNEYQRRHPIERIHHYCRPLQEYE